MNRFGVLLLGAFLALTTGGVVVHIAGAPPPALGTDGEGGPATEAAVNNADDVAVAPNGDIYLADFNSARLLRIHDGILTVSYRGTFNEGETDFTGVAVASDGTVYFTTGLAVRAIAPDGTISVVLGGLPGTQVFSPKLAVGPDDSLYMAGGRIPRIDLIADGLATLVAGSDEPATGPGEGDGGIASDARFGRIADLAIDSAGVMYAADEDFGDVRRIGTDGIITTIFGAGALSFQDVPDGTRAADVGYGGAELGITVDESDRLYIVLRLGGVVWVVDDGLMTRVVGGGPNPGTGFPPLETQLSAATRLAPTGDGDLLILTDDGRVLLQSPGAGASTASDLIESVPSPAAINLDPIVVATSVALTAGMLFLVPFPAEMFNDTLASHYDQIRGWFRRRKREEEGGRSFWAGPIGLILSILVMALLYGFLDPSFGLKPESVPTFFGLLLGVLVVTLGFALPTMVMRRVRAGEWGRLRALPIALLIGVACVVLSRLIGFLPGYLYGIVLGLVFGHEVGEGQEAAEVTVTSVILLAIALGSWFALGAVRASEGGSFGDLAEAALAMITISAFEGLVFGLLPIHGMPGRALFAHRKWLWLVVWGISVLVFFHVLINPQSGYLASTALVPVATTYGLLVVFTLISVGLWAYFRDRDKANTSSPGSA